MTIASILAEKGATVLTLDGNCTLAEAINVLERRRIGALIVSLPDKPLAGVFSERDVVRALSTHGGDVLDVPVTEHMSRKVTTVTPEVSVAEAMEIMTQKRVRHLPVLEDGKLCGIVSIGDVVKRRISMTEAEAEALKNYITTG
ncbi:MAG: CBS domain-containing protein [Alphaproteobacteria bacterium]|nr:CBS domain-containing protein [Alphaproteobacteria bacterium]